MDILNMAATTLKDKLGVDIDPDTAVSALQSLLSGADGQVDLGGLVSRMTESGNLGALVSSWLGDGANEAISADGIASLFGSDRVAAFAEQLGIDKTSATDGLASVLPDLMDKASSGGSLLDMAGGAGGLFDAAKSLFR